MAEVLPKLKPVEKLILRSYDASSVAKDGSVTIYPYLDALIEHLIEPDSWKNFGNIDAPSIAIYGRSRSLLVRHTEATHGKIVELLSMLQHPIKSEPKPPLPRVGKATVSDIEGTARVSLAPPVLIEPQPQPIKTPMAAIETPTVPVPLLQPALSAAYSGRNLRLEGRLVFGPPPTSGPRIRIRRITSADIKTPPMTMPTQPLPVPAPRSGLTPTFRSIVMPTIIITEEDEELLEAEPPSNSPTNNPPGKFEFAGHAVVEPLPPVISITDLADEKPITVLYPIDDLIQVASDGKPFLAAEHLQELIQTSIAPASWKETGTGCSVRFHEKTLGLVVRQREAPHEQIADLLKQLRILRKLQHMETLKASVIAE